MLGLPEGIRAALFDLDGVLTQTAKLHAQAWKQMFDEYLAEVSQPPFALPEDYERYVDGKPRIDGVRSFLESRGIDPEPELVERLGTRKNELVLDLIRTQGVEPYEGSIRYVEAARDAGLPRAVVSSSRNTREVLESTGLLDLFEAIVDGVVAEREGLPGKPAPDTFLAAAADLHVPKEQAVVFEDALVGVEAGKAGGFGFVVGVDRLGQADALREHGADVVVADLADLLGQDR
ncbi:MAG: beta-phosphoglucomutase family hydrolase [Actinomycetota bacterium]|nr:beta-phosphoglucomutase family hydrolase [Actinomycetota bacterium]